MAHLHNVYDTDKHFLIDAVTMDIQNTSSKIKLIQRSHRSERFTFEIPRYIDGHDMSLCNRVEVHYNNIKGDKTAASKGVYKIKDLQISPDSEEVVIFSWLISRKSTKYEGTLNFCVRFACIDENTTVEYERFTDIHKGISISESYYNSEQIIADYSDILEAWKKELEELATSSAVDTHNHDNKEVLDKITETDGILLYKGETISGGVSSWNDIKNKPFGVVEKYFDEVTVEAEINKDTIEDFINNSVCAGSNEDGFLAVYVKVGELPCSSAEYLSKYSSFTVLNAPDIPYVCATPELEQLAIVNDSNLSAIMYAGEYPLVIAIDEPDTVFFNFTFPETGLYFIFIDGKLFEDECSEILYIKSIVFENIEKLDGKYMPMSYTGVLSALGSVYRLKQDVPDIQYDINMIRSNYNYLSGEVRELKAKDYMPNIPVQGWDNNLIAIVKNGKWTAVAFSEILLNEIPKVLPSAEEVYF